MRRLDPAALSRRAVDAVLRDQREDAIGRAADQPDQRFATVATEACDEIVGIVLESGNDLASVAARRTVADFAGLEHDDLAARLGQRERAGKPRIAGADDDQVCLGATFERRGCRRPRRRRVPERVAQIAAGRVRCGYGEKHERFQVAGIALRSPPGLCRPGACSTPAASTPAKRRIAGICAAKSRNAWSPPP